MRHPSKVGAFCSRKPKSQRALAAISGPPHPTKLRRRGPSQKHPSSQMGLPFWARVRMRARADAMRRARSVAP